MEKWLWWVCGEEGQEADTVPPGLCCDKGLWLSSMNRGYGRVDGEFLEGFLRECCDS